MLSENKRQLLALYLRGDGVVREAPGSIRPRLAGASVPLSAEQELIWLHSQLAPGLPLYNEILTVRRTGPLDARALERSLDEIVRRHEVWRTTFDTVNGVAAQIVQPPFRSSIPIVDLSALPAAEKEAAATRLATEEARQPLNLVRGPLVRAKLVRMAESEHRLYVTLHQIVHDGVSVYSVFLPELVALYEAFAAGKPSPLPDLSVQYGDYATWQREQPRAAALEASLAYWRRQLADAPTALEWPTDHARPPSQRFHGRQQAFRLTRTLTEDLKRLSQHAGTTLYVTLLTAFTVLLNRHSGQEDIVIGTAISTRKRPEVQGLLGVFLNTIVLRTRLSESLTFQELLPKVQETTLEGLAHGDVPFHHLVRDLQPRRDPGQNPVFQVTFVLEPPMPPAVPGWDLTQMDVDTGAARVDLYLQMDDRPGGLVGHVRYNADLWEDATVAHLVARFKLLLEGIVCDPAQVLSAIPMLTQAERADAAVEPRNPVCASESFARFEARDVEQSIPQRFAMQAARYAERIAVRAGRTEWTYAELDRAADRVAHGLAAHRIWAGSRVALLLDHDAPMLAGILGVLKAGCAYVPLDPTHPAERLVRIQADASASVVLATEKSMPLARRLGSPAILAIEDLLRDPSIQRYGAAVPADGLAYLLYTSGSTGQPKAVAQNHRNVLHFIAAYTNNLRLGPDDRLTLLASYGVDAAVMDIFAALLNGAMLVPIDVRETGLGGLCERLEKGAVTVYHSTPTLYRHLVRTLSGRRAPSTVRLVVLGGEEVRREDVEAYRDSFAPHCVLVNGFGPTESTVSLQYFVDKQTRVERLRVPVGRPVERTAIALLSREGRPGQAYGEIAIRSPHVALGYWQDADRTSTVFLRDPDGGYTRLYKTGDMGRLLPDGNIEYCGRRDLQTKIQGFRVEMGEIEAALSRHPDVKYTAATVFGARDGEVRLVAYFSACTGRSPSGDALRRFLLDKLPAHMIPSAFVHLDTLPVTSSGKVNRAALPPPDPGRLDRELVEPRNDVERELVEIWRRALGVDGVGLRDDFFKLGGHSLIALRVMIEIEGRFGVNLPLATLLESPTVERLAEVIGAEASMRLHAKPSQLLGVLARRMRGVVRR